MRSPIFKHLIVLTVLAGGGFSAGAEGLPEPAEFEAFMDGLMAGHQDAFPYAGAVVAVVADGKVFFEKGYGVADVATRAPVDPEQTLFRIGSVTKLFGWTALMQLVEQGKIDLDTDINSYLKDVTIPDTFEEPMTIGHLMNHTPGFEDRIIGLFAHSSEGDRSLAELLNEQLPARVRPPGLVTSYSNHGTALAALALEEASGESWLDFVSAHVMAPLQMDRSSVLQPLPEHLQPQMSKGYANRNGLFLEKPFEFVPLAPAGGISATAHDMARFMIAHLQLGELDGARILAVDTAREMQTRSFQNAPGINGMAHGFIEMDRNGHRVIGHSGDTLWFHTLWAILPDSGVGIYASYNTNTGAAARSLLFEAFMDQYFPPSTPPPAPEFNSTNADEFERFEGHYRSNRMAYTTFEKIAALGSDIEVEVDDDGGLLLIGEDTYRLGEVEPLIFQDIDGHTRVRFLESEDGEITKLFMNDIPVFAFDRTPSSESPTLHALLFVVVLPIVVSGILLWPAAAFRRRNDEPVFSQQHLPGAAVWTAWIASVALVVFVVGFAVSLADPVQIVYGLPAHVPALLFLPLVGTALTYVAVLFGMLMCVKRIGSLAGRMHYVAVVTACAVLVWQLHTWNLLGFLY